MMSSAVGKFAGPSPAVRRREPGASTIAAEDAAVSDALRQLPSLSLYTAAAATSEQSARTGDVNDTKRGSNFASTSYALGADDEALLLQELVSITAGATPFVPSKPTPAMAENNASGEASPPVSKEEAQPIRSASASPSMSLPLQARSNKSAPEEKGTPKKASSTGDAPKKTSSISTASAAPARAKAAAAAAVALTSKEEQDILDAILAAVDGQQSSVSGDLTGSSGDKNGNATSPSPPHKADEVEQDAVDRVLEEAKLLATSTVLCETQRGELVLHIHEHVALRRQLAELNKTIGVPSCVALAEVPPSQPPVGENARSKAVTQQQPNPAATAPRALTVAVGTNLGVVALFDQRWAVMGLCGSVEANVVNARGAVVSLSLSTVSAAAREANEEPTAATGHAKGVFILWSLHSLAPLRVIKDECTVPLLRVLHLHHSPTRIVVLESSGAVKLFQFWRVMTKHMLRSTTVTSPSAATPISDVDTLPFPSTFYMRNLPTIKAHLPSAASASGSGVPWLLAPPPIPPGSAATAGVSRTAWSTVADKHLVAAVSNDAVVVYVVESGLQGAVTGVARHTHPPSSALSNELVRFLVLEQDGVPPRVLLCVSWNTEVELLLLNLQLPDVANASGDGRGNAVDLLAQGVERLALLRVAAPLLQMLPLAGCSVLLLDQNNDAQLMDASVAVMVERHHFGALEYVTFASRLCGVKYHGTAGSNQAGALLLGKDRAYGVSVYSWRERLATLVARRKFAEALDLAKGFAEEVALSIVGLSSNAAQRRRELHQYMERILLAYVESCVDAVPATRAASLLDVLQHVASYCSSVDGLDLLYGSLARVLQQRGLLPHLLYVLERAMRNGAITYMPEPLLERFIDLFLNKDALVAVEVALGVRQPPRRGSAAAAAGSPRSTGPLDAEGEEVSGRERAELALMCLDTGLANLLRLAQDHHLLRLAVTILSHRQHRYVEALAYALDEEEEGDDENKSSQAVSSPPSVAVDLVEYTLKDSSLLPGADIPSEEQRPAKKALLEFLLETDARGRHHLLRFVRRQPEHAVRVLLFALSDEGLCSPWSSSVTELCRTQFVSSVFFILTGGTRTQPRPATAERETALQQQFGTTNASTVQLNLFFLRDEELLRRPDVRLLRAGELAQRSFPPYAAVHTFLANAALFDELFLSDDEGTQAAVRLDVWMDLVVQDALFAFQHAETAEERRALQEQLITVMSPPFIPAERIALFQPDFTRLRMARCLAALFCKEQRYTEAIRCYIDPVQNRIDVRLQHDVLEMLRGEMQRLQDLKTHTANAAQQQQQSSASRRFDSEVLGDGGDDSDGAGGAGSATVSEATTSPGPSRSNRASEFSRHTSTASFAPSATLPSARAIDEAIKALQRAVMGQVEALVRIDATGLAQFIFDYLPSNHREVMRLLRGSSAAFLDYLDELMAQGDPAVANDMNLQNTYIELLCAHAPARVSAHLQERGGSITYDVQLALRAVRKYRIADASIYLLERTMMIEEAVAVMESATRSALAAVREEVMTRAGNAAAGDEQRREEREVVETNADTRGRVRRSALEASFASAAAVGASVRSPVQLDGLSGAAAAVEAATTSSFLTGVDAVPAAAELLRLIEVGKDLCRKYQADRLSGNGTGAAAPAARGGGSGAAWATGAASPLPSRNPEYWFRLLDVFMVPRRLLSEVVTQDEQLQLARGGASDARSDAQTENGSEGDAGGTGLRSELEVAGLLAVAARSSPRTSQEGRYTTSSLAASEAADYRLPRLAQPLSAAQRSVIAALVAVYTQCSSDVLRSMMGSLDLSVVMDKVVQDNKDEAFRPFKPIILDMMASLRFDLEASRLCESATESDVMLFGRELYQKLNTGVVALSDCCALCHNHLSEPPLVASAAAAAEASPSQPPSSSAVCVYTCGHAYHTVCCLQATGAAQQSGCHVCAHQRFSSPLPATIGSNGAGSRRSSVGGAGQPAATGSSGGVPAAAGGGGRRDASVVDVARMQRRIRQTKVKLDRTEDLYPLLKSFLASGDVAPNTPARTTSVKTVAGPGAKAAAVDAPSNVTHVEGGGNWVLAPSPRVPAAVGEVAAASAQDVAPRAGESGLGVETLTDAEILELFGSL